MKERKRFTIVGFGDSITLARRQEEEKRWLYIVDRELNAAFPSMQIVTVNSGVGGNTSREGLARIEPDVLAHKPDLVIIEFGGNDATCDIARHVSLGEYVLNLKAILQRINDKCDARIVLLTFPPVVEAWHTFGSSEFHAPYGGGNACLARYRSATRDFAATHDLPLVDIHRAIQQACEEGGPEKYILPDGVHLTAHGNEVVASTVVPVLRDLIREQAL